MFMLPSEDDRNITKILVKSLNVAKRNDAPKELSINCVLGWLYKGFIVFRNIWELRFIDYVFVRSELALNKLTLKQT